ncbi:hypothetical protein FXV77_04180 [Sphingobacterium phlebotomi]|uniref:Outer membrane protein beta-barrel domain-containing protein n=1 Tax=Sphingobacterium phlebotomi TaxID=2605433 RepID=A0A5D4H9E8_9SPHI|nr:hypothetical protein [Sphingobacterium phlebotomi]TYR37224.1 hypothetical protein FXV77_04180 [Sphingobacterium phlebotomi]
MKIGIWLIICCYSIGSLQAQKPQKLGWIWGPSLGWQYQSGNFLKASGWGLFAPNDHQYMKINAGANFTWMQSKTTVIPEIGFTYYLSNNLVFPFVQAEVTPYTLTPKVGISILSIVDLGIGYGFDMQTKQDFKPLKGLTGSVTLNIPLNFY